VEQDADEGRRLRGRRKPPTDLSLFGQLRTRDRRAPLRDLVAVEVEHHLGGLPGDAELGRVAAGRVRQHVLGPEAPAQPTPLHPAQVLEQAERRPVERTDRGT